ncbi:hypothetical protein HMPREF0578_0616 [Mobiluncus mulieris 28-1]|nr:hypothetical protein HMPREF0578_0616 [Mobiluncus mulieris 28-1]
MDPHRRLRNISLRGVTKFPLPLNAAKIKPLPPRAYATG